VLFKPLYENFTDPLLPLSRDLLDITMDPLTFIYGRAYSNLAYLRPFIPFKLSDAQLAQITYLSGDGIGRLRLSFIKLPVFFLLCFLFYLSFGVFYARTRKMPDDFMDSFRSRADNLADDDSIDALQVIYKLFFCPPFFEPVGNMVLLANTSAGRYWGLIFLIKFLFKKWLPHLPKEAPSIFTSGSEGILPTQMGREIVRMAALAREKTRVKEIMLGAQPSEVMNMLEAEPQARPLIEALEKFMATHGHRAIKEMEIGSPRWEENPVTIINMIKNYLHDDDSSEKEKKFQGKREQLLSDVKTGLEKKPLERLTRIRWRLVSFLGKQARYFIKLRENSRFFHIMIFYAIRKKILKKETEFLQKGKLKCGDDIFYLKWKELKALDSGQTSYADLEDLIRSRRLEYIRLCKFTPPKTVGISSPPVEAPGHDPDNKILEGQGASPGVYKGKARVILDPSVNATLNSGEVLVAPYTDPAWTPLFLTAGAAVVETGSYLSHAGTIAREYGMPCVVDVPDCTSLIRSGDLISIDGTNGNVSWEPHEETIEGSGEISGEGSMESEEEEEDADDS
jgi:phosphohistidine swiveling domain-containing protein